MEAIASGYFSPENPDLFRPLTDGLLEHDPFMVLADYRSYVDRQEEVDRLFTEPDAWARKSVLTVSRMGYFSSDRAIQEYCRYIWDLSPLDEDATAGTGDPLSGISTPHRFSQEFQEKIS